MVTGKKSFLSISEYTKINVDHHNHTMYLILHNKHGKSLFFFHVHYFDCILFTINRAGMPPVHGFPPGHFPPQVAAPGNGRPTSSRSVTPEEHSPRSSTPEESRPSGNSGDNEKLSKDDRYKERHRYTYSEYLMEKINLFLVSKSSCIFLFSEMIVSIIHQHVDVHHQKIVHHHLIDHVTEAAIMNMNDPEVIESHHVIAMKNMNVIHESNIESFVLLFLKLYLSSLFSLFRRHHREDSGRHHRVDDDSSRGHRSSRRSPTKNVSSSPKALSVNNSQLSSTEPIQTLPENPEVTENEQMLTTNANATSSSSPISRSRRDESERSSSRHGHHKKSSKRSRRDSGDERSHRRHSRDKSNSSKKTANQTEASSDAKE